MWIVTMFDLPVDTRQARRHYARFRKNLLRDGFTQMQYSVYGRHCPSEENAAVHIRRIEKRLPPEGEVRILVVTEKQFERMRIFWGIIRTRPEPPSPQLTLF
jgi:CRISPR-associated protein Cas2